MGQESGTPWWLVFSALFATLSEHLMKRSGTCLLHALPGRAAVMPCICKCEKCDLGIDSVCPCRPDVPSGVMHGSRMPSYFVVHNAVSLLVSFAFSLQSSWETHSVPPAGAGGHWWTWASRGGQVSARPQDPWPCKCGPDHSQPHGLRGALAYGAYPHRIGHIQGLSLLACTAQGVGCRVY